MNSAIQSELGRLSLFAEQKIASGQRETINEFIDVGEWGLAVEAVSDFLYECEIPISSETYQLIKRVSQELCLKDPVWSDLESQVTDR